MATPIDKVDKDNTIIGVWSDAYTVDRLPVFLYNKTGKLLEKGIKEGLKKNVKMEVAFTKADPLALRKLTDNIWFFSAAKTYQQVRGMQAAKKALKKASKLLSKGGKEMVPYKAFRDGYYTNDAVFIPGMDQLFDDFNEAYFESEYNTAVTMSEMDARWQRIMADINILPYLQYSAVSDTEVCEICAALDGITMPVDDPFWDENYPPQHYNTCRCTVLQLNPEEGSKLEDTRDDADIASKKADILGRNPLFKHNSGKTHIIFQEKGPGKHPYFDVAPKDKGLLSKNFNLPKR